MVAVGWVGTIEAINFHPHELCMLIYAIDLDIAGYAAFYECVLDQLEQGDKESVRTKSSCV